MIIDVRDDREFEIIKKHAENLPDFVKLANVDFDPESLPASAFALILVDDLEKVSSRKFRIDTRANAFLSALYFDESCDTLDKKAQSIAATNIASALREFGMEVMEKVAAFDLQRPKSNVVYFKLKKEPQQEMTTSEGRLEKLASAFNNEFTSFAPVERRAMALKLVEIGAKPEGNLAKYASAGLSPMFRANLMTRQHNIPKHHLVDLFEKRAKIHPDQMARALEALDRKYGVDDFYDAGIPDPYETVFQQVDTNEEIEISLEKLAKLSGKTEILKEYLSPELAEDVSRDPVNGFKRLSPVHKTVVIKMIEEGRVAR